MKKEALDPCEMLAHFYHAVRRYNALNTANSSNLIVKFVVQNATENFTPLMQLFTAVLQQTFSLPIPNCSTKLAQLCILMASQFFIYQLMQNKAALREY